MSFFVEACLGEPADKEASRNYTDPQKFGWKFSSTVNQNELYNYLGSLTPLPFRGQSSSFLCRCTLHLDGLGLKKAVLKIFSGSEEELAREWDVYKCTVSSFEAAPYFAYPFFCFEYTLEQYNTLKGKIEKKVEWKEADDPIKEEERWSDESDDEGVVSSDESDDDSVGKFLRASKVNLKIIEQQRQEITTDFKKLPSFGENNQMVMFVCMEDCGSLFLKKALDEPDPFRLRYVACSFFLQVTEALSVMQTKRLAHFDFHLHNILFMDDKIKIFDWDKAEKYGKVDSLKKVIVSLYGVTVTLKEISALSTNFEYIADDRMIKKLKQICEGVNLNTLPENNLQMLLHKVICNVTMSVFIRDISECWEEMFMNAYGFFNKGVENLTEKPRALRMLLEHLDKTDTLFKYLVRATTELDLSGVNAKSMFNTYYNFEGLQILNFDNNLLETLEPCELLLKLPHLTTLSVSGNNLNSLPDCLSELTNLTSLNVSHNDFESFPKVVWSLANLTTLVINVEDLETLPERLSGLKNLTSLDVSGGNLKNFPEFLCDLPDLASLDVSHNELQNLPECLSRIKKLKTLKVNDNNLKSIHVSLAQLQNLERLDVSDNSLEDTFETKAEFTTLIQLLNKTHPNLEIVTHHAPPPLTKSR